MSAATARPSAARSSSSGKETTVIASTAAAKRKPTALPTTSSRSPSGVEKARSTRAIGVAGRASPMVAA